MKQFEIWSEAHEIPAPPSSSRPAYRIGKASGETFLEAVQNFRYSEDKRNAIGHYEHRKGVSLSLFKNADGSLKLSDGQPVFNMCRLYNNEADAKCTKYVPPKPRRR